MKFLCLIFISLAVAITKPTPSLKPVAASLVDSALVKLKAKKEFIDSYLKKHPKQVIALPKVPGKKKLVKVIGDKWPVEIEYTYNIVKNDAGKVIFISQAPESESGDWDMMEKHYFDDNGKTFAYYYDQSIFDDNVKDGIVRQSALSFYNSAFVLLNKESELLDMKWHPIKGKASNYNFRDFDTKTYRSVAECFAAYNIKL